MAPTRSRKRPSTRRPAPSVAKPRGVLHPRVQLVGPEHFGIVCFDCAKARSKFLLADFYGRVLIPPTTVAHTRPDLDDAVAQVRQAFATHQLRDGLVAIERTGRYHRVVQRTFAAAGFETRILHPFTTKQYRQPVDPGNKTDDTDLTAIHRATVTGCALLEATRDAAWTTLQLVIRHRRDLVRKGAALNCQIRDHLEAAPPGFAACFDKLWDSPVAWHLLQPFPSAEQLRSAGLTALCQSLRQAGIRFQQRTVQTVLDWALQAAPGDVAADQHHRFALALYDDRQRKTQEIQALERESASRLVQTPYVLLLSFPGINVVSAADFAGEMGPIEHYANAKAISGRAGLRPSRYQSDHVDKAHGPLVRLCNRALRATILGIADNLIVCNHHFQALATRWPPRERTHGTRASRSACASAASPSRWWLAGTYFATRASRAGTTSWTSSLPFTATMLPACPRCCATCEPLSSNCRRVNTPRRPSPSKRNCRKSRTVGGGGPNCLGTSCRSC
jgi:transposase